MFYTYILRSNRDGNLYIGYTSDLRRRIKEHNSGDTKSLKSRRPLELIYYEAYKAKEDAERREKMLKFQGRALGGLRRRLKVSLEF